MAEQEVVPPLSEGVPDLQQAGADASPVVPTERLPLDLPPRVVGENPVVVEGGDEVVPRRAGVPLVRGVAMYTWRLVRWGASVSHWHPFAASRWRRASRVPSATASHPSRSPSQPSSSWRSAAAMSVGSMRSKGPWLSPSRDRASSYTGPRALKCTTASWVAPSSGGCHQTVAVACPHWCITVARSTFAA